jgi:hypothetical protein
MAELIDIDNIVFTYLEQLMNSKKDKEFNHDYWEFVIEKFLNYEEIAFRTYLIFINNYDTYLRFPSKLVLENIIKNSENNFMLFSESLWEYIHF